MAVRITYPQPFQAFFFRRISEFLRLPSGLVPSVKRTFAVDTGQKKQGYPPRIPHGPTSYSCMPASSALLCCPGQGVPNGHRERPTDPCLTRHHHFVRLINLPGGAPCSVSQSRAARRAKERAQPPQPGPLQHDSVAKLNYVSHLSPPGGPPAPLAPT